VKNKVFIFITLLLICVFLMPAIPLQARTVYNGTNLDFNLLTYNSTDDQSNTMAYTFTVVNYCTFTANVSDLRVIGYMRSTTRTASGFASVSSSNQGSVYDADDSFVRNCSGTWNAAFSDGTEQDCGTSGGVDHYAKTTFTATYNDSEVIEGGGYYYKPSATDNACFEIRYSDWSNMYKYDDYSSAQDTNLPGYTATGQSGTDWIYMRLEYSPDGGTTWINICESTDTSGTTDTNSGVLPCNGEICEAEEITETVTPTVTETVTPTVTETVVTETVTPTVTETVTPTVTTTITETHTITPTVTPVSTTIPVGIQTAIPPVWTPVSVRTAAIVKTPNW